MRIPTRRTAGRLIAAGGAGAVLLRPGSRANRILRRSIDAIGRHARYLAGELRGASYRLRGRRPDPDVEDLVLADRIRSALGPLEKGLDLPRVHVMSEDHVALLHGEVGSRADADQIEDAVARVSGVVGVESYLHVGLGEGDTRPSEGKAAEHSRQSHALARLEASAVGAGVDPATARPVVRGVLAAFADRLPEGERDHIAAHLPADVRAMLTPPRRTAVGSAVRSVFELVARVASATGELPHEKASAVVEAVLGELRAMVPEEAADVAAVLPDDLRAFWEQAPGKEGAT